MPSPSPRPDRARDLVRWLQARDPVPLLLFACAGHETSRAPRGTVVVRTECLADVDVGLVAQSLVSGAARVAVAPCPKAEGTTATWRAVLPGAVTAWEPTQRGPTPTVLELADVPVPRRALLGLTLRDPTVLDLSEDDSARTLHAFRVLRSTGRASLGPAAPEGTGGNGGNGAPAPGTGGNGAPAPGTGGNGAPAPGAGAGRPEPAEHGETAGTPGLSTPKTADPASPEHADPGSGTAVVGTASTPEPAGGPTDHTTPELAGGPTDHTMPELTDGPTDRADAGPPASAAALLSVSGCTACGVCVQACPNDALTLTHSGGASTLTHHRESCRDEGACVRLCPEGAVVHRGTATLADVLDAPVRTLTVIPSSACTRCGGRFVGTGLCPACSFRQDNAFGSALPPGALAHLRAIGRLGADETLGASPPTPDRGAS